MELQRNAMLMYTSCGWYFDDISGIEALQVMKYAARAIQLTKEVSGISLEEGYLERLRPSRSSKGDLASGIEIYLSRIKPEVADLKKVGVHYAIASLFNGHSSEAKRIYSYFIKDEVFLPTKAGLSTLLLGRSNITSEITRESQTVSYAVLWLGGDVIYAGAKPDMPLDQFDAARESLQRAFEDGEVHQIMVSIADKFNMPASSPYSFKDLFKDKQVEVIDRALQAPVEKAMACCSQIIQESYSSLQTLAGLGAKPPLVLQAAADVIITKEVTAILSSPKLDLNRLESVVGEIRNIKIEYGKELIALKAQERIESEVDALTADPKGAESYARLERLVSLLSLMDLPLNLWRAQNKWYSLIGLLKSERANERPNNGDQGWPEPILRISDYLRVRV